MNKYGMLSILMAVISVMIFFILRGPIASLSVVIIIFTVLSIVGIVFAVMSKKWIAAIAGILLNGGVLVFAYFLLLALGIGGP